MRKSHAGLLARAAGLPFIIAGTGILSERRQVNSGVAFIPLTRSTYDAGARTVELVAATDTPVLMPGWRIGIEGSFLEILDMSPGAVDLSQVAAGNCPLLDTHNRYALAARLGGIREARTEGSRLLVTVLFGESEQARAAEAEFAGQMPPKASAGYRVLEYQFVRFEPDRTPVYKATRWQLTETSLVPIAADGGAGARGGQDGAPLVIHGDDQVRPSNQATAAMTGQEPGHQRSAPPADAPAGLTATEILSLQDKARSLGVETQANEAIRTPGATWAGVGQAILFAAAARQANAGGGGDGARGAGIHVTRDEGDSLRSGIETAIILGIGAQPRRPSERLGQLGEVDATRVTQAREYRGMHLSEMAAALMGERSMPRTARDKEEIFARAFHVTSDFPTLLTNAFNQRLLQQYVVAGPIYRRIAQQITFADFRSHGLQRVGDFPQLQEVNEAGEIKMGTIRDAKQEQASVTPYGIQFNLSRQLLMNDRLGGIEQALSSQGIQVALFEEKTFFAMKGTTGPNLKEDNTAVFAAGHNNLAGAGAAISTAALGVGRAAMRKQKNLQGDQMGIGPSLLLASPDKETEAESVLVQVAAAQASNVNLFSGKLELIIGGQLSGNAWELYADPAFGSNWVWGLLEGYEAPRMKVEDKWGVQGVGVSLEHDFGCAAQDFRFGYRNPGA